MVRPVFILVTLGLVLQLCCSAEGYYFKSSHAATRSSKNIHHQAQRYPHLERLLNRLEKVQTTSTTTTPTPPPHTPVHHWKPQGQDSYEDEDEDDDFDEDDFDDDDDEDEDEDDDEDGDGGDDSLRQQPQGDEHTPSWDVPQNEPHYQPMSPISRMKWQTLGTRKAVEEARSQRLGLKVSQNDPEFRKAVDHMVRMSVEGECKIPKPKLVQVKSEYPHPSKIYLPRCTILHQCGEDTGCCKTETLTCVPRYTNRVELYFYTTTVGSSAPQRVEKLTFYNHTECMCENRNAAMMHRDVESGHYFRRSANYGGHRKSEPERTDTNNCRCPSKFSVRYGRDGACTCDCFDKQRECLRLKKGKDYFSAQDRQCIQNEECRLPSCEFGSYFRLAGRCRKKRERYEGWNP
ncbi:uncharacterized protein [Anabrus simplex]|uniref:uncharacterized protein n=1 Tax=Anabrus simplex TaxID=316456 RepID=UPI0035A26B8E